MLRSSAPAQVGTYDPRKADSKTRHSDAVLGQAKLITSKTMVIGRPASLEGGGAYASARSASRRGTHPLLPHSDSSRMRQYTHTSCSLAPQYKRNREHGRCGVGG